MAQRPLIGLSLMIAIALIIALPAAVSGAGQTINGPRTVVTSVNLGDYDVFTVIPLSGKSISVTVTVTAGGPVDVYVLDQSELTNYEAPPPTTFYPEKEGETTRAWSAVVASGATRYLVVDNRDFSTTGAAPSGPVSYTATYTESDVAAGAAIGLVVLLLFIALIAGVALYVKKQRRLALARPAQPPQPAAPAPPPPYQPTAPYPYVQQTAQPYYPQPYYPQPYYPPPYYPQPYQPPPPYNPPPRYP